jgi:hypothetical protein
LGVNHTPVEAIRESPELGIPISPKSVQESDDLRSGDSRIAPTGMGIGWELDGNWVIATQWGDLRSGDSRIAPTGGELDD